VSATVVRVAGERACGGREVSAVVDDASRAFYTAHGRARAHSPCARLLYHARGKKISARGIFVRLLEQIFRRRHAKLAIFTSRAPFGASVGDALMHVLIFIYERKVKLLRKCVKIFRKRN
jgi:hypothetical protein